jgi:hypothetical protein
MYKGNLNLCGKTRIQVFTFNFIWKFNVRIMIVLKKYVRKLKTMNRHKRHFCHFFNYEVEYLSLIRFQTLLHVILNHKMIDVILARFLFNIINKNYQKYVMKPLTIIILSLCLFTSLSV